ncbi:hypothetical protein HNY73_010597 [Argiope bruennichi]|uniref:Uncharacterized protein n=1 Tax=Argiope bruennichi TaxID=94029 RepID=A0A8T0F1L3_ARGBR|nr:hypothetical protein HNY73_010597 [Argiope bruennichi]
MPRGLSDMSTVDLKRILKCLQNFGRIYENEARPRSGRSLLNAPEDILKLAKKNNWSYTSIIYCNQIIKEMASNLLPYYDFEGKWEQ